MSHPADLRCRACGAVQSCVKDARGVEDHSRIRRRRQCLKCGEKFTTREIIEPDNPDEGRATVFRAEQLLARILRKHKAA